MGAVPKKWIRNPSDEEAVRLGYVFDDGLAERPIRFIERFCRQSKGQWAGKPLLLIDWQKDFLRRLFGWRRPDARRRFRRAYLEIGKKNGKSTMLAGIDPYFILADGEPAPEIYLNAVDRDQAGIIYEETARMVEASPELAKRLEIVRSKKIILDPKGYGKLIVNSADSAKADGVNASHIIFDELHRQKDRKLVDVMEYASAAREEPLWIDITTAGEDRKGVWYEQREYAERVNKGEVIDLSFLGVVYRAMPDDDIDDPKTWAKANPSLGITIDPEKFGEELQRAKAQPSKLANFLRLRLGIIAKGAQSFVDGRVWREMGEDLRELDDRPCYVGLDMSSKVDLTALVGLFPDDDGSFDIRAKFWAPEEGIIQKEQRDGVPYRAWAEAGHLELCDGAEIDFEAVYAEVLHWTKLYQLVRLGADPMFARHLLQRLDSADITTLEVRQGFYSLALPTAELEGWIASRRLRHGDNPLLNWCADNAVAEKDAAGNIKLSKKKSSNRIDGMAALVDAIAAYLSDPANEPSKYEDDDLLILGGDEDE